MPKVRPLVAEDLKPGVLIRIESHAVVKQTVDGLFYLMPTNSKRAIDDKEMILMERQEVQFAQPAEELVSDINKIHISASVMKGV